MRDVDTSWPRPVRPRATSAAAIPATVVTLVTWSPDPPGEIGSSEPGTVIARSTPARAQKAPES